MDDVRDSNYWWHVYKIWQQQKLQMDSSGPLMRGRYLRAIYTLKRFRTVTVLVLLILLSFKDEEAPIPKYIFRLTLNGILKTDISSADEPKESLEGQLPSYYDDVKENNSLIDIKRQLEKRYDVDENPVRDWPTLFYNISQKKNDKGFRAVSKISINKGDKQYDLCSNWQQYYTVTPCRAIPRGVVYRFRPLLYIQINFRFLRLLLSHDYTDGGKIM